MDSAFQDTSLWARSLGQNSSDKTTARSIERLRTAHALFRDRAAVLVSRIQSSFPNLTVHDITHLDALWETSSIIAGQDFELNPLEGFVLGGAFLVHDAALCFEAYHDGKSGVQRTLTWKDAFALERDRDPAALDAVIEERADFAAVRALHASQAADLCSMSWSDLFLIDDSELRTVFGPIIGQIASSHHWDIEKLESTFTQQIIAPYGFPRSWRVDALRIACLLRCADAVHLDSRRAPDFLYALLRREGLSADHWKAQNWLAPIDVDQSDPTKSSLLFSSLKDFGPSDSRAWWIAYDSISIANKELIASNVLLNSKYNDPCLSFQINNISGADSPENMSKYVRANGWQPCSIHVHVSNISDLISKLGGDKLYGSEDRLGVVLREIIQNSRDAIVARREIDPDFIGKIKISLNNVDSITYLLVEDNGIGMSERVLTGPLLDFGTSFWASDLVGAEFPGLRSSKFKPVGKFGIGFYSVFMIAKSVTISSKRWDHGLDATRTLSFTNGLTLRPNLSSNRITGTSTLSNTATLISLNQSINALQISISQNHQGQPDIVVDMAAYIKPIVAGIDVCIEYKGENDNHFRIIHHSISHVIKDGLFTEWLRGISFADSDENPVAEEMIDRYGSRLRPICEDGKILGFAALSVKYDPSVDFMSVHSIGGLASSFGGRQSTSYIGMIDYKVSDANRRSPVKIAATPVTMHSWISDQIEILNKVDTSEIEWCVASAEISGFDCDPSDVMRCLVAKDDAFMVLNLDQIISLIDSEGFVVYKAQYAETIEANSFEGPYLKYCTFRPLRHGKFLSLEMQEGLPKHANSLIGCIFRRAIKRGISVKIKEIPDAKRSVFGSVSALILQCDTVVK